MQIEISSLNLNGGAFRAGRDLYTHDQLHRLVAPRSVAVIGASNRQGAFGNQTLKNLRRYAGAVYPVNPKADEIEGLRCYPSIDATPQPPDCAILAVGRDQVLETAEVCARRGVGGLIVYASGFAEVGDAEGTEMQSRLAEIASSHRMPIAGPNCVGIVNVELAAGLNFMAEFDQMRLRRGRIAVVSQSGALGFALLQGMQSGLGFSLNLAAGNACDIDVADYLNYLADDEATGTVACALEGVRNGQHFLQAARRLRDAGKRLIVYKTGRSDSSAEVALSHTGSLVGSHQAYLSAFREVGAIAVDDIYELLETAAFFGKQRSPAKGCGVGVMATSGGAAVIMADKAQEEGVSLPALGTPSIGRLREIIPPFGRVGNPCDTTAQVVTNPQYFETCVDAFLRDEAIAALVVPMVYFTQATIDRVRVVCELARRYDKPIALVWMNGWTGGPGMDLGVQDELVHSFQSGNVCFRALRCWIERSTALATGVPHAAKLGNLEASAIADVLAVFQGAVLTERESKAVLRAAGVQVTTEQLAGTAEEACLAAHRIGYPVVLKIESPDIAHKTEAGVVRIGIGDESTLRAACNELMAAARRHAPDARINGLLVQQQVPQGVELMFGMVRDAQFGPLITIGFGGVLIEVLDDTSSRMAPIDHAQALDMLRSLRGFRLLQGYRGSPPIDFDALAQQIVCFSELALLAGSEIEQIDVNPVIAHASGITAVDALIVRRTLA